MGKGWDKGMDNQVVQLSRLLYRDGLGMGWVKDRKRVGDGAGDIGTRGWTTMDKFTCPELSSWMG